MNNLVFMFPGQGSQSVGMGKELAGEFKEFQQTFEEASDVLGFKMQTICFEDPNKQLNLTEFTQPAILTFSTAIMRILQERAGVKPQYVAGHSLGEYSALVGIGALNFSTALKAVNFRGQAMQRAVPVGIGAMAAYVGTQCSQVEALCKQNSTQTSVVEVVNYNSKSQMVLSGHKAAIEALMSEISAQKLGKAIPLPVSAPFHSSLMQPAAKEMEAFLTKVTLNSFSSNIVANIDGNIHTEKTYSKAHLVQQVASPVLWTKTLETLLGVQENITWLEIGPGNVLQNLLKKTLDRQESAATNDVAQVKELLQKLGA